jgi:PKD repeat protein
MAGRIKQLLTLVLFSFCIHYVHSQTLIQIRQPEGDVTAGTWTTTPLWSKIDEVSQSPDGTVITCPNNSNSTGEVRIQKPHNPGVYNSIRVNVRVRKNSSGGAQRGLNLDIRVNNSLQGVKTANNNLSNSFSEFALEWTGLNFSREDLNSLQVLFISTGTVTGGNRRTVIIDYIEVVLTYTPTNFIYSLPFSENFNSSTNIPVDWVVKDNQGNNQVWQFGTGGVLSGATGNYAFVNSNAYGSGNRQNTDLVTPLIDCSGFTNITLAFNHFFRQFSSSSGTLLYSIDGGATWVQIQQWTANTANPAAFNMVVPALANQPQVRLRWNYTGMFEWHWSIDDISVAGSRVDVDFTGSPLSVYTGETVVFTDQSSSNVNSWSWNFGPGAIPAIANTKGPHSVVYTTSGPKTVTLTVNGNYSRTRTNYITVIDNLTPGMFSYGKILTIPAENVSGTGPHINFPLLVSFKDQDLKHQSHGGRVQHIDGFDIIFTLDDCVTKLDHQVERYDGTSGELIAWVRVPNLSASQNTILQMYYGYSGILLSPSTTKTWAGNYKARYHLNQVPSSGVTLDYTFNQNNSVAYEGNPARVNGKIGFAYQFSGSDAVNLGNRIMPGTRGTLSLWIKSNQPDNAYHGFLGSGAGAVNERSPGLWVNNQTSLHGGYGTGGTWCSWTNNAGTITNGSAANWHYIVYTYATGEPQQLYIDGVLNFTFSNACNNTDPFVQAINFIGRRDNFFVGQIDEVGISSVVHNAGWVATEFRNQNSPETFIIISPEYLASGLCRWIWTGNVSSDWNTAGNWNKGSIPDQLSSVLIMPATNNPLITSDVAIQNIEIQSGAIVSIGPLGRLTVSGSITNNTGINGLIIQSSSAGTGSLIHNTNNLQASFQRYISGKPQTWQMLSSPVQGQTFSGDFTPTGGADAYADGTRYDIYAWHEPDTSWVYLLNTTQPPTWLTANGGNTFIPGRGYLFSYKDLHPTKVFQGVLSNGGVSLPITKTVGTANESGFNLIGNPYPSSIDWKSPSGWGRNMLVSNGGGYDIWIWSHESGNYGVYNSASTSDNGTLGVTRYIAPTQGFFVKAASSGSFSFSNDIRVHDGAGNWLKNSIIDPDQLRILVHSQEGSGNDEVILEFGHPGISEGTVKKFSMVETAPQLFFPVNDKQFSIQLLGKTGNYPVVPLAFKAGADGNYRLSGIFNQQDFRIILLHDKVTGIVQDLKANPAYLFYAKKSDPVGRFILQLEQGVYANPFDQLPIRVFTFRQVVNIDMRLLEGEHICEVFSITGNKVLQLNLTGGSVHKIPVNNTGIFVVRVVGTKGSYNQKVILF